MKQGTSCRNRKIPFSASITSPVWIKCSRLYLGCNLAFQQPCSQISSSTQHLGGKVYCIVYKVVPPFLYLLAFDFLVLVRVYNHRFEALIYTQ